MMLRLSAAVMVLVSAAPALAQKDPGPRGGAPGSGGLISGLTSQQQTFLTAARERFTKVDDVADGLGPRFNLDSCSGCHSQPAIGGTTPAVNP
jgi:hypothetical protein